MVLFVVGYILIAWAISNVTGYPITHVVAVMILLGIAINVLRGMKKNDDPKKTM
jgi:hypothetical protein